MNKTIAVTEPELEGKAVRERGIESALIKLGWTPPSKKAKNETDALREENAQLRTQLHEARLIAQGMVEAMKQDSLDDSMDLVESTPVVKKVWVNVYRPDLNIKRPFCVYGAWGTKERAEDNRSYLKYAGREMYVGTFPLTFEVKEDAAKCEPRKP